MDQRLNERPLGGGLYALWNGWDIAIIAHHADSDQALVLNREGIINLVEFAKEVGLL